MTQNLHPWWRGGIIYQIYPRSFYDSNGDGIGDLPGVTQHLSHVAKLGVEAVWLSPFFTSPMKDFGYDVSDYRGIAPIFGTLDDFRALLREADRLGLKILIDLVLSHTSDQHPWFKESSASRTNAKADWYVWANSKDDGTPPNNWLAIFGGSAWHWHTERMQYYLHNFLTSQPDLNFHNPAVQDALLDVAKFWLDMGVYGFRLDTVNFYFHDQLLRDNPGRGQPDIANPAVSSANPYSWQFHVYDKSRPECLNFLSRLRALTDQYPDRAMVGEIGDDNGLVRAAEYTFGDHRLHMAYAFEILGPEHHALHLRSLLQLVKEKGGQSWQCWSVSNHDVMRVASRWGPAGEEARTQKLALMLLLAMRGTPCLYQGDELGLPEAELAYEDLQDPFGITMWPKVKGRDGCRTPLPWSDAEPAGKSWLPCPPAHRQLNVARQNAEAQSTLQFTSRLIALRKQEPALIAGDLTLLPAHEDILAFERTYENQCLFCLCNMSHNSASYTIPAEARVLIESGGVTVRGKTVAMPPRSAIWLKT